MYNAIGGVAWSIGNISNMFYGRKKLIRGSRLRCRGGGFTIWEDRLIALLGLMKGRMIA